MKNYRSEILFVAMALCLAVLSFFFVRSYWNHVAPMLTEEPSTNIG